MQDRMDKYSVDIKKIGSRAERNKELYESVKNSSMENYEIKSNVAVIDEDAKNINVSNIRKLLDERYSESSPKRKSIEIPDFEPTVIEEPNQDTKEYDINAILSKARQGKNVDYNKERLKKVRETNYEILNNLDLELKKVEKPNKTREEAENNLRHLIDTITELEIKNQAKDTSTDLDLLSDLSDNGDSEVTKPNKVEEIVLPDKKPEVVLEKKDEIKNSNTTTNTYTLNEVKLIVEQEKTQPINKNIEVEKTLTDNLPTIKQNVITTEDKVDKTLSKLDINLNNYDEFADISKRDGGSIILKIIIFIIVIVLVFGAIYILNDILSLGLF